MMDATLAAPPGMGFPDLEAEDEDTAWMSRRWVVARTAHLNRIEAEETARGNPKHNMVCMYWLKGRCRAGDLCRFLHVMNHSKLRLCQYFIEGGRCPEGSECLFRHFYLPHEPVRGPRVDPHRAIPEAASA
jgi:hypothetical protein